MTSATQGCAVWKLLGLQAASWHCLHSCFLAQALSPKFLTSGAACVFLGISLAMILQDKHCRCVRRVSVLLHTLLSLNVRPFVVAQKLSLTRTVDTL